MADATGATAEALAEAPAEEPTDEESPQKEEEPVKQATLSKAEIKKQKTLELKKQNALKKEAAEEALKKEKEEEAEEKTLSSKTKTFGMTAVDDNLEATAKATEEVSFVLLCFCFCQRVCLDMNL